MLIPTISTTITVSNVLNTCSNVCDFAVTDIFSLPLKYPLSTEAIVTKNIAGDNDTNVISASGICKIAFDIYPAPTNNTIVAINPIIPNVNSATLNILCAPLSSPIATFSDTSFDMAFGTPIDDIVSKSAYI